MIVLLSEVRFTSPSLLLSPPALRFDPAIIMLLPCSWLSLDGSNASSSVPVPFAVKFISESDVMLLAMLVVVSVTVVVCFFFLPFVTSVRFLSFKIKKVIYLLK